MKARKVLRLYEEEMVIHRRTAMPIMMMNFIGKNGKLFALPRFLFRFFRSICFILYISDWSTARTNPNEWKQSSSSLLFRQKKRSWTKRGGHQLAFRLNWNSIFRREKKKSKNKQKIKTSLPFMPLCEWCVQIRQQREKNVRFKQYEDFIGFMGHIFLVYSILSLDTTTFFSTRCCFRTH